MEASSKPQGKVLIVDDEAPLRRALHGTLYGLGFDIGEAASGEDAIALCRVISYDTILLDITLPGKSGIETCAALRRLLPRAAILMLSVTDNEERKIEALDAGADDYVTKPFQMRELIARIRSAVRRVRTGSMQREEIIEIGDVVLNAARRTVQKAGTPIHMTPKEFELLHCLMANAGLPVTHARLIHSVWGADCDATHSEYLRTLVRQLRKKLQDDAMNPRYLLTESRIGYRFMDPG